MRPFLIALTACAVLAAPAEATTVFAVPADGSAPVVLGTAPGTFPSAPCWNADGSVTVQPEEQRAFFRFPGATPAGPRRTSESVLDTSVPARCGPRAEYHYGFEDRGCCRYGFLVRDALGRERLRSSGEEVPQGDEAAVWSPDASRLATVLWESPVRRTLRVYDVASGRRLLHRRFSSGMLEPGAFTPDGRSLFWTTEPGDHGAGQRLMRLDVASGQVRRARTKLRVEHPSVSPDGTRVAVTSDDGELGRALVVLDAHTGATLLTVPVPVFDAPLAWSPDGTTLAVRTGGVEGRESVEGLALVRVEPATQPRTVLAPAVGALSGPVWSPDGRFVAAARGERFRPSRR